MHNEMSKVARQSELEEDSLSIFLNSPERAGMHLVTTNTA